MKILEGKKLAQTMQAEIAAQVADFARKHGLKPGLAAVIVGDNPASQVYVRNKRKACDAVGMTSWLHTLPAETTQDELLQLVEQLNCDPRGAAASSCSCRYPNRSTSRPSSRRSRR